MSLCAAAPPNGVGATDEQQAQIEQAISQLEPLCADDPARRPLSGVYDLVYCTAQGGSNGRVGPFVGTVTQEFVDEQRFINAVELFGGAVKLSLFADRKVLDSARIKVTFRETAVCVFGNELLRKPLKGAGTWVQRYVDDELRVMDTPSVFILRKRAAS